MPAVVTNPGSLSVDLDEALDHLISSAASSFKSKASANKSILRTICDQAERHGLSDSALTRLLDFLTSHNSLDQTSRNAIVNALFSSGVVPTEIVFIVVNSLGRGKQKVPMSTQQSLIKWLVMVYDLIEKPAVLSGLYSVLFNLLDMINLRANLCQLLARITRRKHVKPFRIQMLQALSQSVNREPALEKLVQIYDNLASEEASAITPGTFVHPDPEWGNKLRKIHEAAGSGQMTSRAFSAPFNFSRRSLAKKTVSPLAYRSNTVVDIDRLDDVVNKFEEIEIIHLTTPDLEDQLLQQYLVLRAEDMNTQQVDDMLSTNLKQHLEDLAQGKELNVNILESILPWTRYTKILPNPAVSFFAAYLPKWRDQQNQSLILNLLSYLPITPFSGKRSPYRSPPTFKQLTSHQNSTPPSSDPWKPRYTANL